MPVRPSASLQNRVYLPTIDAFLQKFAVRCGSATLLAPVPKILHTASTKAFSAASRPPLVPKVRTALLRRLFLLQVDHQRSPMPCNSAHRAYLTTSGEVSARVEQSRAKGDGNSAKSTHKAYLTTFCMDFVDDPGCSM